jgi:hypothetical protein
MLFQGVLGSVESPEYIESISIKGRSSKPSSNLGANPLIVQVNLKDGTNIPLEFYRKPGMIIRMKLDAA